jgi:hypothetical protein
MTGSPLFRLFAVLILLGLLGATVWTHTGSRAAPQPAAPAVRPSHTTQHITLTFTSVTPPDIIRVESLGSPVASLAEPTNSAETSIDIEIPREGIDLVIQATWIGDQPINALRVQAEGNGQSLADVTLWGDKEIRDVVMLTGDATP